MATKADRIACLRIRKDCLEFVSELFSTETDRLAQEIRDLAKKNENLGGSPKGFIYGPDTEITRPDLQNTLPVRELSSSLVDDYLYLKEKRQLLKQRAAKARSTLASIVSALGQTPQQLRDVLPDYLCMASADLKNLARENRKELAIQAATQKEEAFKLRLLEELEDSVGYYLENKMFLS